MVVSSNSARWVESARLAMLLTFPLLSLVALALIILMVTGQYQYEFVYGVTSNSMPLYLKITALWGGQAGSLVFWSWLLSAFVSAVTLRKWERDREFLPWVIVVALVTVAFFLVMTIFFENPFNRFWLSPAGQTAAMFRPLNGTLISPADGNGLNPLLRHPGMVIHPPMLVPGFCLVCRPIRLCHCSPGDRAHRRPLDPRHPALDAGGLVIPLAGAGVGQPLGV